MEIRIIKISEIDQAIQLADQTFREEGHTSMGEAFPHVFSKEMNHSFGAFEGDRLVSFIGLVPSQIQLGESVLNVFSIGAVCTHEDYRKRGISSAILKEVYQYIDHAGASLLFISGDRGLYTRNHCYHFGKTYQYSLSQSNIKENNNRGLIRQSTTNDIFKIDNLRRKRRVRFKSSPWEWPKLLQSSGYTSIYKMEQTCFVADHQGEIRGYIVIGLPDGKNSKQEAIVTEWGGQPKVVHDILADILEKNLATHIEITIPWHEEYHDKFGEYFTKQLNHGGTIYLVDAGRLIRQASAYICEKNPELARSLEVIEKGEHNFELKWGQSELICTEEELLGILFNVQDELINNELQTVFPLPLPSPEGMYYV